MNTEQLRFERLSHDRIKDVRYLYETIFKKPVSADYLTRKYNTAYTGSNNVCFLAYDEEKPVSFYGALPQRMMNSGTSFLGVQACDSVTLPAYQGKGIHTRLATRSYELMKEHGAKFIYAYHSENTFHSCKKLNWSVRDTMKGFLIKVPGLPVAKAVRKSDFLSPRYDQWVRKAFKKYLVADYDFANSNSGNGIWVDYSQDFFRYKNFTNNMIIELEKTRFWIKISSGVMVGDVSFSEETDLLKAIQSLRRLCQKLGITEILFQTTRGTKLESALSKHFTDFESWRVGYLLFDESIDFQQFKCNYGDLDTF